LIGFGLSHDPARYALCDFAQFFGLAGFIPENDCEKHGRISDPIRTDLVADTHNIGGQSLRGLLDTGRDAALVHNTIENNRHKLIIPRFQVNGEYRKVVM
jgi:hypothetical protein